jgi:hypothetical protein
MNDDINRVDAIEKMWDMINENAQQQGMARQKGAALEYTQLREVELQLYMRTAHHALGLIKQMPAHEIASLRQRVAELEAQLEAYEEGESVEEPVTAQPEPAQDTAADDSPSWREQGYSLAKWSMSVFGRRDGAEECYVSSDEWRFQVIDRDNGQRLMDYLNAQEYERTVAEALTEHQRAVDNDALIKQIQLRDKRIAELEQAELKVTKDALEAYVAYSRQIQAKLDKVSQYLELHDIYHPGEDMIELLLADAIALRGFYERHKPLLEKVDTYIKQYELGLGGEDIVGLLLTDAIQLRMQEKQLLAVGVYWHEKTEALRSIIQRAKVVLGAGAPFWTKEAYDILDEDSQP